ncbi:MAG TPA: dTMP kinase [Blastocatellia bacterium]|nr:dTMP kinase [Blastocatellia bacterium]
MRGLFITFEGIDGCGKSTQIDLLFEELRRRGLDVVVTREPGGTVISEAVRELLVSDASVNIAPKAELLFIVGARAQHVAELIKPALEAGRVVLSDRYTDSTVAFQGHGRGLDLEMVDRLNNFATGGLLPDITIVFDLDPSVARARLRARPVGGLLGAFDDQQADFHTRVRQAYLTLAEREPSRVRVVDASGAAGDTHAAVMTLVLPLLTENRQD